MRLSATIVAACAGLCAIALSGVAHAGQVGNNTTAYNPGDFYQTQIPVTATVGGACGFATGNAPTGTHSAGDVSGSWTVTVPFKLDCNVASRVAVVSQNGGLLSGQSTATGYTNLAPYNVQLNLTGNSTTATGTCAVSTLTATQAGAGCAAGLYGTASSSIGLKLNGPSNTNLTSTLVLTGTAASGILVSSNLYTDTLTVTIAASP